MTFAMVNDSGVATRHYQPLPVAVTEGNRQQHMVGPRWFEAEASSQVNKRASLLARPIDMLAGW